MKDRDECGKVSLLSVTFKRTFKLVHLCLFLSLECPVVEIGLCSSFRLTLEAAPPQRVQASEGEVSESLSFSEVSQSARAEQRQSRAGELSDAFGSSLEMSKLESP